jgi:hypothetical protein
VLTSSPIKVCNVVKAHSSLDISVITGDDSTVVDSVDAKDTSYVPEAESSLLSESASSVHADISFVDTRKFIVFENCLDELFKFCQHCGSAIESITKFVRGSMLGVRSVCSKGCEKTWHSQPQIRNMAVGNLILAGAVLFCGGQYSKIHDIASCMNLAVISKSTFFAIQDAYLFPVIQDEYDLRQTALLSAMSDERLFVCGDGQCDSPGHTAKYLTYTLMEEQTQYIVDSQVVCVSEVANSNAMELEGLKRCIARVEGQGVSLSGLATDRHLQVIVLQCILDIA